MGIFGKLKNALKKTGEGLKNKLSSIFSGRKIDDDFYDDLEDVLISSDIGVNTSMSIVEKLRKAVKENKVADEDGVVKLLKEELKEILNGVEPFKLEKPAVLMVIGVNGVGKTTSIGKLASMYSSKGNSVTIAAADTFRAAAADQLAVWADRANVKIVKSFEGADPSSVVFDAVTSAKTRKTDVLIIDTAGRLHVKETLMEELKKMNRVIAREYENAHVYKLIALDATTGQNALNQVKVFNEAVGIDGIILTKLDGTAKGGFVINLCNELHVPVAYVGTGESVEDVAEFDADEFVDGIL